MAPSIHVIHHRSIIPIIPHRHNKKTIFPLYKKLNVKMSYAKRRKGYINNVKGNSVKQTIFLIKGIFYTIS